jgi:hypothetical protein
MQAFKGKVFFLLIFCNSYIACGYYPPEHRAENSSAYEHLLENPFDESRGKEIRREIATPPAPKYAYAAPQREQVPSSKHVYDTHQREWVTLRHQIPPPPLREQVSATPLPPDVYGEQRKQVASKPQQVSTVYGVPSRDPVAVSHVSRRSPVYDMASNIGKKSYYAGIGVSADVINPHGRTETNIPVFDLQGKPIKGDFNNSGTGMHFSPKIFIGMEDLSLFKECGLRLQVGADFHTIHLNKKKNGQDFSGLPYELSMNFYFNYTFNIAAQVTKRISNNLDGYLGVSLLGTWAQISQNYVTDDDATTFDSGETSRFMLGISPQVGFIYRASDKLFYYLDAHLSFYQRISQQGISVQNIFRFDTIMTPRWGGISAGAGWKL